MTDAEAAATLQRILGKGWQVEPIAKPIPQPDFVTHADMLYRAVQFRACTYKDPAAHSRKMAKRFGADIWEAFCRAADQTKGQGLCFAAWEDLADAAACAALGWKTCQQERAESLAAFKAKHCQ